MTIAVVLIYDAIYLKTMNIDSDPNRIQIIANKAFAPPVALELCIKSDSGEKQKAKLLQTVHAKPMFPAMLAKFFIQLLHFRASVQS